MEPLSPPPNLHGLSATNPAEKILCNSVWIRGKSLGLRLGLYCIITLRVLRFARPSLANLSD
jgi:hypothetical protein